MTARGGLRLCPSPGFFIASSSRQISASFPRKRESGDWTFSGEAFGVRRLDAAFLACGLTQAVPPGGCSEAKTTFHPHLGITRDETVVCTMRYLLDPESPAPTPVGRRSESASHILNVQSPDSRESGNPAGCSEVWVPAFAGMTGASRVPASPTLQSLQLAASRRPAWLVHLERTHSFFLVSAPNGAATRYRQPLCTCRLNGKPYLQAPARAG